MENRPWLRYHFGRIGFSHTRRIDNGDMQSERIYSRLLSINSHQADRIFLDVQREREGLVTPFAIRPGIVIPAGVYAFNSFAFGLESSDFRVISPDFSYTQGDFYDGKRRELETGINWQPGPRFSAEFGYTYTDVELPQGDFVSRLVRMNTTFAFDSTWSWINLLQYDNFSQSMGLNSRLNWNPQAGENLYLVVNYNFDADGVFNGMSARDSEITLKYTKNFRF